MSRLPGPEVGSDCCQAVELIPMKSDVCPGTGSWVNGAKKRRAWHPHKRCRTCDSISLPPRTSEVWCCCRCGSQRRYAVQAKARYQRNPNEMEPSDIETWVGPAPRLRIGVK